MEMSRPRQITIEHGGTEMTLFHLDEIEELRDLYHIAFEDSGWVIKPKESFEN